MKLIDFLSFPQFEQLRRDMGAKLVEPIKINPPGNGLNPPEKRMLETKGIELESLDILTIHDDGTLVYKNTRVLLYIRDWTFHDRYDKPNMPKFHISNCTTLRNMAELGKANKYVIATRDDGIFIVNKINNTFQQYEIKAKLDVCKNCLSYLDWEDYSTSKNKNKVFSDFTLLEFFKKYPKSLLRENGKFNDKNAPLNSYSDDWAQISEELRRENKWVCQKCNVDCSNKKDYLHVHHINGLKYDNTRANLKVLCQKCHSMEPGHEHLRR